MKTPICDFVANYKKQKAVRLHMPGHKGKKHLGAESYDITEISGADVLYAANDAHHGELVYYYIPLLPSV